MDLNQNQIKRHVTHDATNDMQNFSAKRKPNERPTPTKSKIELRSLAAIKPPT